MPASSLEAAGAASDQAACRGMMQGGSHSFSAAARLLPRRIHEPATALYAFCRLADDLVDCGQAQDAVGVLQHRLDLAYEGRPANHPADRAFADVVARTNMPRALPLALLEGFAWDLQGRRYATLEDLLDYAARVAGSVGAMMAVLMGVRSAEALARACDLGVAMQLTNIARDVGEDAHAGRLYLPLDWLKEAGLAPDTFLSERRFSPALAGVVGRLLHTADGMYARGRDGIKALPLACRPGIRAAATIYADIGRVLAQSGCDSISTRVHVPTPRKMALLGRALLPAPYVRRPVGQQALPACQYLVDAVVSDSRAATPPKLQARVDWVFDLFERLQEQQLGMS